MVPFVSRMICWSVRITKCKSRSKVETVNSFSFLFRQDIKSPFAGAALQISFFFRTRPAAFLKTRRMSGNKS